MTLYTPSLDIDTILAANVAIGGMNLKPSTVPRLVKALLACAEGATPARSSVAVIGSSTARNVVVANDVATMGWPERAVAVLQQSMPVSRGGFMGTGGFAAIAQFGTYEAARFTPGAGLALANVNSLGGSGLSLAGATAGSSYQHPEPYDNIDLWLTGTTGVATEVGYQIGGGAVTARSIGAGAAFFKQNVTKALGSELITISKTAVAGGIVQGIDCWNSTVPKVRFLNMARAGWSTVDWTDATDARSPFNALRNFQPLAIVLDPGPNDWRNSVPVATFKTNIQAIIDKNKDLADIILSSPFPGTLSSYPTQGDYQNAMRELAISNNLPLIDFTRSLESWEISNPQGYYRDSTHLVASVGNPKVARFFARWFSTLVGF